eukprot:5034956-Amphidinium_carterae.1
MQVDLDDMQVASDSDVPDEIDEKKTWVQTLEDEHGVLFHVRGKKRCRVCRGRDGLMRRCSKCHHHVHGTLQGVIPESMGGICFLNTTGGDFLCRGAHC